MRTRKLASAELRLRMALAANAPAETIELLRRRVELAGGNPDTVIDPQAGDVTQPEPQSITLTEPISPQDAELVKVSELVQRQLQLQAELEDVTSALREMGVHEVNGDKESAAQDDDELAPFADYEPIHVAAVAAGAEPRWVHAPNGGWLIAARWDQVLDGLVRPVRRDGTGGWVGIDSVMVSGQVSGEWVAVLQPLPKGFAA